MRTRLFFSVFISIFSVFLINCCSDDEVVPNKRNSISGTWSLTSYGGGFTGQFSHYNKGVITWDFDTINNQVHIKRKREYFGPSSGTYPFELRHNGDNQILYLNDSVQGMIYLNEYEMIFDNVLIATFIR